MLSHGKTVRNFLQRATGVLMPGDPPHERRKVSRRAAKGNVWARPGMRVTFRAELMPGRVGAERSFRVASVLPRGRVHLDGIAGEHTETEFEAK